MMHGSDNGHGTNNGICQGSSIHNIMHGGDPVLFIGLIALLTFLLIKIVYKKKSTIGTWFKC